MDTDHKVWANAVDALACGIAAISPDGKILTANRAWREFWGDAGTDFSKLIDDALPGADAEAVAQSMAGVVAGGPEFATEFAHGHAPEQRWVRLQISRLADDPPQALACLTDITDLCEDRDTPAASEAKFKALYEATGDAVMLFEDGRMVDCNPASAQLLGFERMENVLGLHPWEFSPELQPNGRRSEDLALERIATVIERGVSRFEWTHVRADGSVFPADVMLSRIDKPGGGQVFQAVVRDITERKEAEQELRISQATLAKAQEIAHIGSWDWNIVTNELSWSDEIYRIFGLRPQEFGATYEAFLACIHRDDREMVEAAVAQTLEERVPYSLEHRVVWADGTERTVHERGEPTLGADGEAVRIIGTVQDITERRHVEDEIRRLNQELEGRVNTRTAELSVATDQLETSEAKFRMLVETMNDGLTIVDANSKITYVNDAFCRMLGRAEDELMGADSKALLDEANQEVLAEQMLRRMQGEDESYELMWTAADGRAVHSIVAPRPLFDDDGEYAGSFAVMTDISRRKQAERKLELALEELQRSNGALEDFAYVASHDLQEPLRKIVAFGGRIETKFGESLDEQGRDYLDRMQNAARRMQTLINDLLTFSRLTTKAQPFAPVDLTEIVADVVSDLEVRIEDVEGEVRADPLPTIDADPLQIRQLLQNLIGNALKFRKEGVSPIVRVSGRISSTATPMCEITVQDNGIGFEGKHAERIFGVFERLHGRSAYEGTGMGLAICRKIAERHGGTIAAHGEDGEGATFTVSLPVHQKPTEA